MTQPDLLPLGPTLTSFTIFLRFGMLFTISAEMNLSTVFEGKQEDNSPRDVQVRKWKTIIVIPFVKSNERVYGRSKLERRLSE